MPRLNKGKLERAFEFKRHQETTKFAWAEPLPMSLIDPQTIRVGDKDIQIPISLLVNQILRFNHENNIEFILNSYS